MALLRMKQLISDRKIDDDEYSNMHDADCNHYQPFDDISGGEAIIEYVVALGAFRRSLSLLYPLRERTERRERDEA